jgi:hypothetical protein
LSSNLILKPHPILKEINESLARFGEGQASLRTRLTCALAVEVVRKHLLQEGFPVSERDVFIRGLTPEIDLLLPSKSAKAEHNLVYEPKDVRAVLEIKYSGVYNQQVIPRLQECFDTIKSKCPDAYFACVVIHEREGFRYAAKTEDLGYPVYTLHWWSGDRKNARDTGEWETLIKDLRGHFSTRP